jgi:hypothetical protein
MKIHEYNEMMRWLTRPKDKFSLEEKRKIIEERYKKSKILDWSKYSIKEDNDKK